MYNKVALGLILTLRGKSATFTILNMIFHFLCSILQAASLLIYNSSVILSREKAPSFLTDSGFNKPLASLMPSLRKIGLYRRSQSCFILNLRKSSQPMCFVSKIGIDFLA